jgi:hypothetical protein
MGITQEDVTVTAKELTLSRFGEKVSEHGVSGTVSGGNRVRAEAVGNPEMADVEMTGTSTSGRAAIGGEFNGALIVLVENIVQEGVALCLKKIGSPNGVVEVVRDAQNLGLG